MSINVCIPTLNAVDEFWACIKSIQESSISCNVFVVDNGGYVLSSFDNVQVYKPLTNLGVAGSWNWFLNNISGPKIITNDDIVFDKDAIRIMQENFSTYNLVCPENLASPFSCFMISDAVVSKVGKFDEWISPKYAYFEDNDYSHRMSKEGVGIIRATGAFVQHAGSSTLKHFDKQKEREHHDKFRLARAHYVKKWGGEPGQEKYNTPFGQ